MKNKQLEFVNGGWVDNDEASPVYEDMINNFMIAHEWLKKEFDVVPRIGWTLDAFGHSDTNTRLYAEMGYDAMFYARMPHLEKSYREANHLMNFLWRPSSENFGNQLQVLNYVFNNDYCPPSGLTAAEAYDSFDFIETDQTLSSFNADKMMEKFIKDIHYSYDYRHG